MKLGGLKRQPQAAPYEPLTVNMVLERLLKAHEAYYDVERDYELAGRTFAGFAALHADMSTYVLIKRAKLWEAHTHEYMFFHTTDYFDEASLQELLAFMKGPARSLVNPEPDHMTSYLSLVVLTPKADEATRQAVRRSRYRQNLRWGFAGWIDLRLALVEVNDGTITTNGQGKDMRATLEANLSPVETAPRAAVTGASDS